LLSIRATSGGSTPISGNGCSSSAATGVVDDELASHVAGPLLGEQIIAQCDVVLSLKPLPDDIRQLRNGRVLWSDYPHARR
jgi:hypothetical protein